MSGQTPTQPQPSERYLELDGAPPLISQARRILFALDGTGPDIEPGPGDIVISPSQLSTWSTCRLRWYLEKVIKVEKPQKLAPSWGTAMHRILEEHNKGVSDCELFHGSHAGPADMSAEACAAYNPTDGGRADIIAREVLGKVDGIDVDREARDVIAKTHTYLRATNWDRRDNPEEDATVYLFTVLDHDHPRPAHDDDKCFENSIGYRDGSCPHIVANPVRVFLRGITDFSVQRPVPARVIQDDDVVIRNGEVVVPGPFEKALGDYKSSGRKWAAGRTDREPAPSFYALRERARTGTDSVSLVHEVILKKPTKCKFAHHVGVEGDMSVVDVHPEPSELCFDGHVIGQRFITDRGLAHMGNALLQIAQFAKARIKIGNDPDAHPPSPGWDDGNCRMCDVRPSCWLKGGIADMIGEPEPVLAIPPPTDGQISAVFKALSTTIKVEHDDQIDAAEIALRRSEEDAQDGAIAAPPPADDTEEDD